MVLKKSVQLVLERIRIIILAVKKSELFKNAATEEGEVLAELKQSQAQLRSLSLERIEPWSFLKPMLKILASPTIAGPFKLTVLEALHTIIGNGDVLESCDRGCLEAILESLTGFKFIETEAKADEKVNLQLMRTIHHFLQNMPSVVHFHSLRPMLNFLFQVLAQSSIAKRDSERYRTIIETVKLIITRIIDEVFSDLFVLSSSNTLCSCFCQLLGHLQDVFRKHVDNVIKMESILERNNEKSSPETTENNVVAADRNNLRTCLHLLQHLWRLFGEQPTAYWKVIKDNEIGQMLSQEIGYSMVALVSRVHLLDTITAQHLINLFTTIVNTDSCAHRHVIAFFYKHVFIKYLHHVWVQVSFIVRDDFPLLELLAPEETVSTLGLINVENDLLEYIIDSLCDLLANPALLPSLFASFDCDPASPDLIQTMTKHVTTLAAIVLTVGAEGLGEYKEIGVQLVHCSKQLFVNFQDRSVACDAWQAAVVTTSDIDAAKANALKEELDRLTSSLQFSKVNKQAFITACELFNADDHDKCFLTLQSLGFFPKPVTPIIIAQFLRHASHLNKTVVGSYVGSLGKESSKEWNTVHFHAEVLKLYTQTFNFTNQFALSSLRAFLSAFRLPGEAQQIDRILVAFSEHCHAQCRERQEGIIENSEILYVLMFATIMLNTDRHNVNIKPERKMTVDQFVRSNTNYKQDCKQTIPIPREYLVALYDEISSFPLRTEPNSTFATVTKEEWMDMSLHADLDWGIRSLLTTAATPLTTDGYEQDDDGNAVLTLRFPHTLSHSANLTVNMRNIQGLHFLWDKIMLRSFWQYFLIPSLSLSMSTIAQFGYYADLLPPRHGKRTLKQRQEFTQSFLKEFLALAIKNGLENVLDIVVAVLLECTGILDPNIVSHLLNGTIDLEANLNFKLGDAAYDCEFHLNFVDSLSYSSARSAVIMMLEIITAYSAKITNSWELVLFVLALLRDFHLLPAEMINDTESDLLPQSVRQEFEHVIRQQQESARQQLKLQQEVLFRQQHAQQRQLRRANSETSTLQLLGNALFGTTEPPLRSYSEDEAAAQDDYNQKKKKNTSPLDPDNIREYYNERLNNAGSRWDASLFGLLQGVQVEVIAGLPNQRTTSGQVADERGMVSVPLYDAQFISKVSEVVSLLVPETKFLPDEVLLSLVASLIHISEANSDSKKLAPPASAASGAVAASSAAAEEANDNSITAPPVSAASVAWLEMVLVDIVLRNRDRLLVIWPLIRAHYLRSLSQRYCDTSYVTERRIYGMTKLIARLLSRDHYAALLIELLGNVLLSSSNASSSSSSAATAAPAAMEIASSMALLAATSHDPQDMDDDHPLPTAPRSRANGFAFDDFAMQIAAGVWRILTQNVDLLPYLSIEQWETVFLVMTRCAAAGSFASFKTFETLAWLLHEPRLIASVPVFCVVAIQPLVTNPAAPGFVSVGAVNLLKYLHARLEGLIADNSTLDPSANANAANAAAVGTGHDDGDISSADGSLWKKCWQPVLQSLANGVADERELVRESSALALCDALRDRHLQSAPSALVIDILTGLLVPVIHVLEDYLVAGWNKEALRGGTPRCAISNSFIAAGAGVVTAGPTHAIADPSRAWGSSLVTPVPPSAAVDPLTNNEAAVVARSGKLVIEHGLETLAMSLLNNLDRVCRYPSFDKLWLRTLQCLLHFAAAANEVTPDIAESSASLQKEQVRLKIAETAVSLLKMLLKPAVAEQVFKQRQGLAIVTKEFLIQTAFAGDLDDVM